jgi:hypothetical protein
MTENLLHFNAFGLVKTTVDEVVVTITAITETGKAIHQVFAQVYDKPLKMDFPDGFVTASFAAMIEDKGSRIAFSDNDPEAESPTVGDIPGVTRAVGKSINMVRESLAS